MDPPGRSRVHAKHFGIISMSMQANAASDPVGNRAKQVRSPVDRVSSKLYVNSFET